MSLMHPAAGGGAVKKVELKCSAFSQPLFYSCLMRLISESMTME